MDIGFDYGEEDDEHTRSKVQKMDAFLLNDTNANDNTESMREEHKQ
jgi:hypothetical protein